MVRDERRKNPDEKKLLSLKRDRRNVYGENAKSSRKNIPRSKQLGNEAARSVISQVLAHVPLSAAEMDLESIEARARTKEDQNKHHRFKKRADAPLIVVLLKKKTRKPLASTNMAQKISLSTVIQLQKDLPGRPENA